jgi:hypothetical protein
MRLSDTFDVPEDVASGPHSPAFEKFLRNWFGDTYALTHGELDITFLNDLTPEELELARELIRRNLKLRYLHVIQGASALRDPAAVPILRQLLDKEPDMGWRLTISGALWKINRDPVFLKTLRQVRASQPSLLGYFHTLKVLWLDDERALDFLIDLLDVNDPVVHSMTLGLLNELEFGRPMAIHYRKMPHQPGDYNRLRSDPIFRARMTEVIHQRNLKGNNGGWGQISPIPKPG